MKCAVFSSCINQIKRVYLSLKADNIRKFDFLGGLQMVAEKGNEKTNQEGNYDVLKSTQTVIHKALEN